MVILQKKSVCMISVLVSGTEGVCVCFLCGKRMGYFPLACTTRTEDERFAFKSEVLEFDFEKKLNLNGTFFFVCAVSFT